MKSFLLGCIPVVALVLAFELLVYAVTGEGLAEPLALIPACVLVGIAIGTRRWLL